MKLENKDESAYLTELYTQTQGDIECQVSMYDVGTILGLDDDISGEIAQSLFIQGVAELKTLSGGIGITLEGLKALNVAIPKNSNEPNYSLGNTIALQPEDAQIVEKILDKIKETMASSKLEYDQIEECVIDIKTIETQMLSIHPKTAIIKEIFRSLYENLSKNNSNELTAILNDLLSSK